MLRVTSREVMGRRLETRNMAQTDPGSSLANSKIAYSPRAAALATDRSRSRIYLAIKDGELVARKDGRKTLIEATELQRWVNSMPPMTSAAAS
jgi:excisionase family DNA binding protein